MTDALHTLTIAELAPKIKAKEISPVEVTDAVLAQADRLQPILNTFITLLPDAARRVAREQEAALMRGDYRGPLHGIPIGIKDNLATAGAAGDVIDMPRIVHRAVVQVIGGRTCCELLQIFLADDNRPGRFTQVHDMRILGWNMIG